MDKTLEERIKKHRNISSIFSCIFLIGTGVWRWLDLDIPLWCHWIIFAELSACFGISIWNYVISDKLKRGNMR